VQGISYDKIMVGFNDGNLSIMKITQS